MRTIDEMYFVALQRTAAAHRGRLGQRSQLRVAACSPTQKLRAVNYVARHFQGAPRGHYVAICPLQSH